jgi:Flp pilus assembly protein TadD
MAREAKQALPSSPVVADTLGWAFYKLGSYPSAISQLSLCVQKAPGDPEYRYHLGMAYLGAQRFDLAAASFEPVLKGGSDGPYAGNAKAALAAIGNRSRK